ncbi:MAG: 50S ribosomal protein L5 [Patescibacteria group bacterium]|jgi:large subunit ribosomal protein L5
MATRFSEKYKKEILPKMKERFHYKNEMAVPKLTQASVNIGFGKEKDNEKAIEYAVKNLVRITGQQPQMTKARKSIASFKVREGQVVGAKVTLRGRRMEQFLDKLVSSTLPRVRDFRGLSLVSFQKGETNYTVGVREHNVFPEIKSDEVEALHGLEVTIVTTAKTAPEAQELLTLYGFPFTKEDIKELKEEKPKQDKNKSGKTGKKEK